MENFEIIFHIYVIKLNGIKWQIIQIKSTKTCEIKPNQIFLRFHGQILDPLPAPVMFAGYVPWAQYLTNTC